MVHARLCLLVCFVALVVLISCAPLPAAVPPAASPAPAQATATSAVLTSQPAEIQPTAPISPTPAPPTEISAPTASPTGATVAPATGTAAVQTSQPPGINPTLPISATATLQTPQVTSTLTTTVTATAQATTASGGSSDDNLAFLPMGEGRTLLLANCSNCHSFVCAVIGQRTEGHLRSVRGTHLERVSSLTTEELDTLFAYLYENFGENHPEPQLPEALAGQGCTAQ